MKYAGCDVGSLTAKVVIFEDGNIAGKSIIEKKATPQESSEAAMRLAVEDACINMDDITYIVSTGYGKDQVPMADSSQSEIACHARGAWWCSPSTRTVVDIGGKDTRAIRVDNIGNVINYRYNDKSANGTGRFLEVIAKTMEVELNEMGTISKKSTKKLNLSNQLVGFSEREIVLLIKEEKTVPDIIHGLSWSVSLHVAALAKSIGIEDAVGITGGVAKNSAVCRALKQNLHCKLATLNGFDPQLTGALGAALLAQEISGNSHKAA
jgi:predicted CoA-substrate-specific enzyme activase